MIIQQEAAEEQELTNRIRFNTDISSAAWDSAEQRWLLTTQSGQQYSCGVLFGCTGYYRSASFTFLPLYFYLDNSYETPYEPGFPGQNRFPGRVVHPQHWNAQCDEESKDKNVAIIGSGATAVTILPVLAESTKHLTLVQRTPTYIAAKPKVKIFRSRQVSPLIHAPTLEGGPDSPAAGRLAAGVPGGPAQQVEGRPARSALLPGKHAEIQLKCSYFHYSLICQYCTRYPDSAKRLIKGGMYNEVKSVMSKEEFEKHFR